VASARATEFLKEALALWGERGCLRVVRADAGFFDNELLTFFRGAKAFLYPRGAADQVRQARGNADGAHWTRTMRSENVRSS
jgi:hypothetical protein